MADTGRIAELEAELAQLRGADAHRTRVLAAAHRHGVTDPEGLELLTDTSPDMSDELLDRFAVRLKETEPA